ncbi:hypothetical protein MKK88_20510 [Methylobacterium sp. E-005]|uniref:hypothetical protein n=2 Tax=Methylobacterium sp. E-005 TaxID=2836549 RepID=UPI001FB95CD8|nr:hypothetical protein [Methylobacterium sp. E-005]MCJ2088349.1 hypothetical protein [Methylobacterium sp. E-005]
MMFRLSRRLLMIAHIAGAVLFLLLCPVVAFQAGDWHWPYVVQSVDVAPDPVPRGGTLSILATRVYLDNCDLTFARQIESVSQPNEQPTVLKTETIATPWRFNGRAQTLNVAIPRDFPCGSAQIRTSPSAACNWLQGYLPQRQRDALTPFEVACTEAP